MVEAKWRLAHADQRVGLMDWLTIERAAYAALAVLAVGVRLWGLGWTSLGPAEAAQALPAWVAASGRAADLTGLSPLLFTLQRLSFTAFGAGDALARFWPALVGGLTALLFYALREPLARSGALAAALLWTLSPLAVWGSRQAAGDAFLAPLALAALAAGQNAKRRTRGVNAAPMWLAIASGLLLAAGPGAYTALLIAAVAALIWRAGVIEAWQALGRSRRRLALAGLLALGLAATCFFTAPAGLAAAAELAGTWWRNLRPGAGPYGAWDILRRLLLSEPLLLGLGAGGLAMALRRGDGFGRFAGLAVGVALLAPVVGAGRQPADLVLVVLGLTLLAGPALAWIGRQAWSARGEADFWLLFALGLAMLVSAALAFPNALMATQPNNVATYTTIAVITTLLTVALWLIYGIWGSWRLVACVVPLTALLFGLAWGVGQLTALSYDRDPGRRSGVLLETPDPNLVDLGSTVRQLAGWRGTGGGEVRIDLLRAATSPDPVTTLLAWRLRDYPGLRLVNALPTDPAPIVITSAAAPSDALRTRYSGADFAVLTYWRPESLQDAKSWWRWLLYREAGAGDARKVVVWVDRTVK